MTNEGTRWINDKYDIGESHVATIPVTVQYQNEKVVAIIGESGSGKSTILREWFGVDSTEFELDKVNDTIFDVLSNIIGDFEETSKLLFDVGLSSVPVWKNKYTQLSNGEKLRFEIAYKLLSDSKTIFIDEYTSMLDRQTAKNLSLNLNKLLDKYDKSIVLSTCHYDILDWIEIEMVIDTTLKKSRIHKECRLITHTQWKLEMYNEICGEYLSNFII